MYLSASTRCFSELPLLDACRQLSDLEYDKVELHFNNEIPHLHCDHVLKSPEQFALQLRDSTRLSMVAFDLAHHVDEPTFSTLSKTAKLYRITQISIPSSPLGTPFNEELDRLRMLHLIASRDGVRLSIKTAIGCLTHDPRTAVEICQNVKGLGLTLDPSHYTCGPQGLLDYENTYPYVYHVQLRDSSLKEMQVPVGLGEVDYNKIIASLKKENYMRNLSVDLIPDKMSPDNRLLEMRKMRMLIDSLL